jgi:catalase
MSGTVHDGIKTRKVAILAADGAREGDLIPLMKTLKGGGAKAVLVGTRVGALKTDRGRELKIDASLLNTGSVLYDAVYVAGGKRSVDALLAEPRAAHFVKEAYGHAKAIAASADAAPLLEAAGISVGEATLPPGVVVDAGKASFVRRFVDAIAAHRHWEREEVPPRAKPS